MCFDPISLTALATTLSSAAASGALTTGLSIASTAAGFGAQYMQFEAQTKQYNQGVVNARAAEADAQKQLTLRQSQEQGAFALKDNQQVLDAARRRATVSASAASSGVQGISVDNLTADVDRRINENRMVLDYNYRATAGQLQAQKDATVNQAASRINAMAIPSPPSPIGAALSIAGAGIKGYGEYSRATSGGSSDSTPTSGEPMMLQGAM
jgi:hypothetical protein